MPRYDFLCPKCKKTVEIVKSINNDEKPLCFEEGCNGEVMESVLSAPSFVLKGSCWARDGYQGKK